jgi:hypothetical protein
MSAGRIVLLIFGILFVLGSFGLLTGGGIILAVDNAFKDDQGYYTTGNLPIDAVAPAIISQSAEIHIDTWWYNRNRDLVSLRVNADNADPDRPVFIGVAREPDLAQYLDGIAYYEVRDINFTSDAVSYFKHSGTDTAPPPADQTFWIASASGTGTQTLEWDVTSGTYSLVFMNADGSSPVSGSVDLGINIPAVVGTLGWGLLIGESSY